MAQNTTVVLIDDLDGSDADETVDFSLDGIGYEIDLQDKNARGLRDALAEYVAAARRVRRSNGHRVIPTHGQPPSRQHHRPKDELDTRREWARANGWPGLSTHGRIPTAADAAYDKAHGIAA